VHDARSILHSRRTPLPPTFSPADEGRVAAGAAHALELDRFEVGRLGQWKSHKFHTGMLLRGVLSAGRRPGFRLARSANFVNFSANWGAHSRAARIIFVARKGRSVIEWIREWEITCGSDGATSPSTRTDSPVTRKIELARAHWVTPRWRNQSIADRASCATKVMHAACECGPQFAEKFTKLADRARRKPGLLPAERTPLVENK
jgi:hypothetical protein